MRLIKLYKDNCAPCKMVDSYLNEQGLEVESVNVYNEPEVAMRFNTMSVPVTILIDGEEEVSRVNGFNPSELDQLIEALKRG